MDNKIQLLSKNLQKIADNLNKQIEDVTGKRFAFTLMIFTDGQAQYISSTDRATSLKEIKRMIGYWEKGLPDIPAHEKQ